MGAEQETDNEEPKIVALSFFQEIISNDDDPVL